MPTCGIIPPRSQDIIGDRLDDYLGECILKRAHLSPHLIKTPEGRYIQWEDDPNCDCCQPSEDDHCYVSNEITEERARQLLQWRE